MLRDGDELRSLVREELARGANGADLDSVRFLAAGEYTLNYRVSIDGRAAVLRIVTGSQMGLDAAAQALYEAHALAILQPTGRVPVLIGAQPRPDVLDYPYLLLSYLPGTPLDYRTDLVEAARCVAAIHRLALPPDHGLQVHADPVSSILHETSHLLGDLPVGDGRWELVRELAGRIEAIPAEAYDLVRDDQAIINTDLNSHNFIVDGGRVWLIDWEKARIGPTLLDIAHFLLPTTTLWRDATATRLNEAQRKTIVAAYLTARPELDGETYRSGLRSAMRLAALRAVAWCAWAVVTAELGERAIQNEETLAKCRLFTSVEFLEGLTGELWR